MENQRDPIVMRAIEVVRRRYAPEQWVMLDVKEATRDIYNEIRRLDLESVRMRAVNGQLRVTTPKLRRPQRTADDQEAGMVWAAE
jgi:hypothetical protein